MIFQTSLLWFDDGTYFLTGYLFFEIPSSFLSFQVCLFKQSCISVFIASDYSFVLSKDYIVENGKVLKLFEKPLTLKFLNPNLGSG